MSVNHLNVKATPTSIKGVSFLGSSGRVFLLEPPTTTTNNPTKKGGETSEKKLDKSHK